jgi:hypothetical protein
MPIVLIATINFPIQSQHATLGVFAAVVAHDLSSSNVYFDQQEVVS